MSGNRALWRSLRGLSHPVTIASVLVLLLNDHVLRIAWPSWWTGKLGDFSWLAFFPLVLAVPLALIVPSRLRRQPEIVAGLAFGLTGLMFATMKTIPAVMDAGLWLLSRITAGPFILRVDPTDLLVLPGLLIGWWVWREAARPAPASRGWAILALGALATVATGGSPAKGLDYLAEQDDGTITVTLAAGGPTFSSLDGGLTWRAPATYEPPDNSAPLSPKHRGEQSWLMAIPDSSVVFRFTPGKSIEYSANGGVTWVTEVDLTMTQAQEMFYSGVQRRAYSPRGPSDAIYDAGHQTVVVAMGDEGILTRTPDGQWHWVDVGIPGDSFFQFSRHSDLRSLDEVAVLLFVQICLALDLPFLALGLTSLGISPAKAPTGRILIGSLALLIWFGVLIVFAVKFDIVSRGIFQLYVLVFLALSGVIFGVIGFQRLSARFSGIPREVWWGAGAAPIVFLLPYVLWSQGIIPELVAAVVVSVALAVAAIGWAGYRIVRQSRALVASQSGESQL